MKMLQVCAYVLFAATSAFSASAQEVRLLPIDDVSKVPTGTDAASMATPVGFTPFVLNRMFNNKEKNHLTFQQLPANWGDLGWKVEGLLGYASVTAFAGGHPLYLCYMASAETNWLFKYFSSNDANCEGWSKPTFMSSTNGWIADSQFPGSVPLYRCYIFANRDHFDSLSATCEGVAQATNEGVLGYVLL